MDPRVKAMISSRVGRSPALDDEGDVFAGDDSLEGEDRTPYESIARDGAPEPNIIPDTSAMSGRGEPDSKNDPLMQQYEADRADRNDFQRAQMHAQGNSNIIQALTQAAQGVNAPPKDGNPVFGAIAKQNSDAGRAEMDQIGSRAKVMEAIARRKEAERYHSGLLGVRKDTAELMARSRDEARAEKSGAKRDAASAKADADQAKTYTMLRKDLESFRGNRQAAQAEMDRYSAEKALALVKDKDPNTLTTQELNLLANEMGKIASGGVPGEHGVQAMMPSNLRTKFAEMQNFLASKPTDAQAGDYVRRNMQYLQHMTDAARDSVAGYRKNILKGYKARVRPEDYDEAVSDYGLRDESPAAAPPIDPQDAQALEWLKSNPNDPAASKVKAKLKSKGLFDGI